ncbi:MAG: TraR/DksA family transcriptional regulator [Chlorobi bacterium]|nr:TraR/DksA family transcriptional regulator [Chlorobiota bacterium]
MTSKDDKNKHVKTRYSDEELEEFRQIILKKLERTEYDIKILQEMLESNDITQTKILSFEDSSYAYQRDKNIRLIARLEKFRNDLQRALIRIDNKTYGICRETGKLISKERLRAVPHTTLSIEAKKNRDKKRH